MATWFATANGNINSAGRWNSAPDGSGSSLTWPPASGDILVANGKTIVINVSINLGSGEIRHDTFGGATAGGLFTLALSGISLTANITHSAGGLLLQITGNVGSTFIVGNITAGNGSSAAVLVQNAGVVNITGNITTTGVVYGINYAGTSSCNVVGTVTHSGNGHSILINNSGAFNLLGSVITTNSATGNAVLVSNATGAFTASGYVQAGTAVSCIAVSSTGVVTVGETRSASNGRGAVTGAFRFASTTAAKSLPIIAGTQQTLSVLDVAALVPAVEDVRAGLVYGDGAYTGTLSGGGGGSKKISMMRRI